MAVPAILFFAFPLIVSVPVMYAGYRSMEACALLWTLLVRLLVSHALLEEILFRGLIQTKVADWCGRGRGIAASSLLFILWHPVLTYQAIANTSLSTGPIPVPILFLASALPLAAAGAILALLRLRSGSLLAPFVAHWTVNTANLAFLVRVHTEGPG
jgi:membrane protease YdiL (CAAX protease family)